MPRSPTGRPAHGRLDELDVETLAPGVTRRAIRGKRGMLARLRFEVGARLAEHAHGQEELVVVERGRLLFRLGEAEYILGPGEFLVLPAGVRHEVQSLGRRMAAAVFAWSGPGILAGRGKGVL